MGLLQKLIEHKDEFYRFFDKEIEEGNSYFNSNGEISHDDLIPLHLNRWVASRIYGGSASMVFTAESTDAIILIDKLAHEYFSNEAYLHKDKL